LQAEQRLGVIRRSVVREMAALGRRFYVDEQVVRGPGRTAVAVREHREPGAEAGAAPHLDLGYVLRLGDGEGPVVWDCVSGLGRTEEQRLENGVRMWRTTTAGAVVELLERRGLHGDVFRPGAPAGVPGWYSVQGPAAVFGFRSEPLTAWVEGNHLLPALASEVLPYLDDRSLHGVRVFFGGRDGDEVAEVRVDGEPVPAASAALRALTWPRGEHLAWARCFVLLTRDPDALRNAETTSTAAPSDPAPVPGTQTRSQPPAPMALLRRLL
jgi:hypothetical protein